MPAGYIEQKLAQLFETQPVKRATAAPGWGFVVYTTDNYLFGSSFCRPGYASQKDIEAAIGAGYSMHLTKPVEPAELSLAVQKLLSDYHNREQ